MSAGPKSAHRHSRRPRRQWVNERARAARTEEGLDAAQLLRQRAGVGECGRERLHGLLDGGMEGKPCLDWQLAKEALTGVQESVDICHVLMT